MFCIKCGADNLEAARFCRKCGADVSSQQSAVSDQAGGGSDEGEEETRVAVRPETDNGHRLTENPNENGEAESELFSISPTLMFVKVGYVLAAVGALLMVALTSLVFGELISISLSIALGLLLFLIPAFYHVKKKMVRYTLTDSKLEIDEGFISRTTRSVPIRRIQDVTVSARAVQRLLGFGDLMIDNASDEGGKVVLKNINTPKHYGDVLLKQMRRLEK